MRTEVALSLRETVKSAIFISGKKNTMVDVFFKNSSIKVFPGEKEDSILEQLAMGANFQFFNGNRFQGEDLLNFVSNVIDKTNRYKIPSLVIWGDETEFSVLPGDNIDFVVQYQLSQKDVQSWYTRN